MSEAEYSRQLSGFRPALPAKTKAAAIHLALSIIMLLAVLWLVLAQWYPRPHFAVGGGWQGMRILFGVSLVAGPLLTFILFNPAKGRREALMDFGLIAVIQLAAFAWGVHTLYQQRPAAIVASEGMIFAVSAASYEELKFDPATLRQLDPNRPPLFLLGKPQGDDVNRYSAYIDQGVAPQALAFLYERPAGNLTRLFADAAAWEWKITAQRPELKADFQRLRAQHGAEVVFLPLRAPYGDAVLVMSRQGVIVDSLEP